MEGDHEDLSKEKLREHLFSALRCSGILDSVKGVVQADCLWRPQRSSSVEEGPNHVSQLRARLLDQLRDRDGDGVVIETKNKSNKPSLTERLLSSLFLDYLGAYGYTFTLSVFLPESQMVAWPPFSYQDMLQLLHLDTSSDLHHRLRIAPQGKGCLAQQLVMVLQQMPFRSNTQESSTQTESNMEVDESHRHKEAQHMLPFYSIEDRINILHKEFDARVHAEVAMQVSRVRELEVSSVRLEEAARYRRQLARDREELEKIHKSGLDQKKAHEESLLERLFIKEKEMEASANEQRQKLMADVNRLRDREEKLRKIKDMQERREEKLDKRELLLKAKAEEVARVRETLSIKAHDSLALRRKELEEQYKGLHAQLQADRALIEDERVQMKVDRVAMAIELASARSDKELMQALHHRLSAEENQRLALINNIRDLEHRLHRNKSDTSASSHGTPTDDMPTQCGRLEEEKLQGVVLAAERSGVEWRLSQREVQQLQQKLQLKGNELEGYRHRQAQWVAEHKKLMAANHQHEAALRDAELKLEMILEEKDDWTFKHKKNLLTINQLETATKNAIDEKDNTHRRLESLRVQLRASESELLETVTLLKKTQQALEVERLQHYSLRSRTNSFLSLYRFNCASASPGQQDVLHGECKGQSDACFKAMSLTEGWDPLKYLDEVPMPVPKIIVTDESGSRPKIFQNQQTIELRQEANDIWSQINFNEDSDTCFSEETSSLSTRFPNSSVPASNAHMFGVHERTRADYSEHKNEMTHAILIKETLDGSCSTFRQSAKEFAADLPSTPLQDDIESVHSLKDTPSCRKGGGRKSNLLESVFVAAAQYSSGYQPQKGKVKKLRSTRQNHGPQHSTTTSMSTASDSENSSTSGGRSLLHSADTTAAKEVSVDQLRRPNFASTSVEYYEQSLKSTNIQKQKTQALIEAQRSSTKGLLARNLGTSEVHACCLSESEITREESRGRGGISSAKSSSDAQVTNTFRLADWSAGSCDLSTLMNEVTVTRGQGEAQESMRINACSTNGLPSKPSWSQEDYMGALPQSEDLREEIQGSRVVSPLQSSSETQMTSTCYLEDSSRRLKPASSCKTSSRDSDTQMNRMNVVTATGEQGEVLEAPMMLKQSLRRNPVLTETICTKGTFLCCSSSSDDTSTREDSRGYINACIFDSACCSESEAMGKPEVRTGAPENVLAEKLVILRYGKDQKRAASSRPGSWKETASTSAKESISECTQTDDDEFQSVLSSKTKSSEGESKHSRGSLETQPERDEPTLPSPSKPYTITNQRLEKPQLSDYKKGFLEVGRQRMVEKGMNLSQESISEYKQKKTDAQDKPSINATLASPKRFSGGKRVQFGHQQGEGVQEVHIAGFGRHKEVEGLTAIPALHLSQESSNLEVFKQFIQGTSNPSATYGNWSDYKHGGPEKHVAHEPAGCKEVGDGAVTRRVFSSHPEEENNVQKKILQVTEAIQVSSKGQTVLVANVRAHEQHFVGSLAQCEKSIEEEKTKEFTCSLKEEGTKLLAQTLQGVSGSTASLMREIAVRVQGAQEQRVPGKALRHGETEELSSSVKEEDMEEASHKMGSTRSILASTFSEQGDQEQRRLSGKVLRHVEVEETAVGTNISLQNWKDRECTLQTTHSVSEGSAINTGQALQTMQHRSQKDSLGNKTGRREKMDCEAVNRNLFSSQTDQEMLDLIQLSPAKSTEGVASFGRIYTQEQQCVGENFRHETYEKEELEDHLCRACTQETVMETLRAQSDESASFTKSFTEKCARQEISEDAEMGTEPLSPRNKNTMVVTQESSGGMISSITKKVTPTEQNSNGDHVLRKVVDVSLEILRPQSNNNLCNTPKLAVTEQGAGQDNFLQEEEMGREPFSSRQSNTPVVASRGTSRGITSSITRGGTPMVQKLDEQHVVRKVSGYEKLGNEDANRDWITLQRKQEMKVFEQGFNEGLASMIRAPSQQLRELLQTETAAGEGDRHTKENASGSCNTLTVSQGNKDLQKPSRCSQHIGEGLASMTRGPAQQLSDLFNKFEQDPSCCKLMEHGTALNVTESCHGSEEDLSPTKKCLKSSTKEEETRVTSRPSPSTLSITNITGGPMRELSELLSMHEASLRERFKHSKTAETSKRIGLSEGGMPTHSKGFREKEDPGKETRAKSDESVTRDREGRVFEAFQTRALMELSETRKHSAVDESRSRETVSHEGQLAAECPPSSQSGVKEEEKVPSWSSARVKLERKSAPWLFNWTAEKVNPRLSSSYGDTGSEKANTPKNHNDFENEEPSNSGASFVNDEKGVDNLGKSVTEHIEYRGEVPSKMNGVRICSGSSSLLINFDQKLLAKEGESTISEESCCDCILRAPSVRTLSLATLDGLETTSPPSPTVTDGQEPAAECSVKSEQGSHSPAEDVAGDATSWLDECRSGLNAKEPLDYNDILGSPGTETSETNALQDYAIAGTVAMTMLNNYPISPQGFEAQRDGNSSSGSGSSDLLKREQLHWGRTIEFRIGRALTHSLGIERPSWSLWSFRG